MTLSLALNNALSGLRVTSQQAELASTNISNALTPGYSQRTAVVNENLAGGISAGARVIGIERASTPVLDAKRLADGDAGFASLLSGAVERVAAAVGAPNEDGSLSTAASDLINSLALAADTPESRAFLDQAVRAAGDFSSKLNGIAGEVQTLRNEADASIAQQIDQLNTSLGNIQALNAEIQERSLQRQDTSALQDQRDQLIEEVSDKIPVKVIPRENDTIAIYARNGGQLLDGRVAQIEFEPTRAFGPEQTVANGALGSLIIEGRETKIGETAAGGLYDGGSLAAAFQLRDTILPSLANDLDALAEDVIIRTQGLSEDPTLAAGDAGLFTDSGAAYNTADRLGVALRLSLNSAVDPIAGGDTFRIRDGIGAATAGESGASVTLRGILAALEEPIAAPSGSSLTNDRGFAGFAGELSTVVQIGNANLSRNAAFEVGKAASLADAVAAETAVNSDEELARLLVVERAFAANARVVTVVDEMLEQLIAI